MRPAVIAVRGVGIVTPHVYQSVAAAQQVRADRLFDERDVEGERIVRLPRRMRRFLSTCRPLHHVYPLLRAGGSS